MGLDGTTKLGAITKNWSGLIKEIFTDADDFAVKCKNLPQVSQLIK